ncbi:coniferyl aldehyde dehydrogenase [Aliidiomarina halalkaliphila]|uniref:Aldehyde dehydrogenase n=1 Tax=Aliidiomarina halalkaliphila TaxID=2593535 RepID=A0A552X1G7_9GAMM|nr:coniferyl aldehyde dehydrogenase [Aliidiomarina halalkaliphila]TRW48864.1 coniferyl aldehyde dehydrogenase [Aliidiomarina halalkaliphila]
MNVLTALFQACQRAYHDQPVPPASARIAHLERLEKALLQQQEDFVQAINDDFGKRSEDETRLAELLPSLEGIKYAKKRIKRWMRPSRRSVGLAFQPAKARVEYQPLGVVGIIVPWNYPLYLAIGPLTAALAAGNRVLIKMSEYTPATATALQTLIAHVFREDHVTVVTGGPDVGKAFAELPFDHLLFTGGTEIGRHVMAAAAKNLTPVTLELGGKSPAIIGSLQGASERAEAAERIAFGKALNAGQTCVAPDYVLCPADEVDAYGALIKAAWERMYPSFGHNPDYTQIINDRQYQRLTELLDDARTGGATVIQCNPGNESFANSRVIPPTIVMGGGPDLRIYHEEIFGPILPIKPYAHIKDAVAQVNQGGRPLALYYFGFQESEQRYVLEHSRSGGVCINDTVFHVAQDDLPFGGVGQSGMGHYHGHEGFLTFSQARSILTKGKLNSAKLIYPPYGGKLLRLIYRLFIR